MTDYGRRRRVPGLRREELAQLAGVSVAYYTRLEQRDGHNVSAEVLDAIARALRLDGTERAHLMDLARPKARRRRQSRRPQQVRPALRTLMDAMDGVPAYLVGHRQDVIGWNRLAAAVFGDFGALPAAERNLVRLMFLDPATAELYGEWECQACWVVSNLRLYAGQHPDDEQLSALVGELSVKNEEFRRLWAAHTVADKTHGVRRSDAVPDHVPRGAGLGVRGRPAPAGVLGRAEDSRAEDGRARDSRAEDGRDGGREARRGRPLPGCGYSLIWKMPRPRSRR